ncbi:unnamed protein product [Boreogadus saida]
MESLDELEDDDGGDRERKMEQQLVQANTVQNEAMNPSPGSPESPGPPGHLLQETPRSGSVRHKSPSAGGSAEEDMGGSPRQPAPRQPREPHTSGSLERRLEELEKELLRERQENNRLLKDNEENQDLIGKLKEEIDLLNRDLDDIEDENDQLKQENKTLLKVALLQQATRTDQKISHSHKVRVVFSISEIKGRELEAKRKPARLMEELSVSHNVVSVCLSRIRILRSL